MKRVVVSALLSVIGKLHPVPDSPLKLKQYLLSSYTLTHDLIESQKRTPGP